MSFHKFWFCKYYRRPKTTQELRANQDKNDPFVRGRRRHLPTAWSDKSIHTDRSWKNRRKTQYRPDKPDYGWHSWKSEYYGFRCSDTINHLVDALDRLGCYYEFMLGGGVKWYGPEWPL